MKKLILILLLPIFVFAQYGATEIVDGDCETPGTVVWVDNGTPVTNDTSSTQSHGGTYSRKIVPDAQYEGARQTPGILTTTGVYRTVFWIYGDGAARAFVRVNDGAAQNYSPLSVGAGGYAFPASWTKEAFYFTYASGSSYFDLLAGTGETSGTWYLDDVKINLVLDTLYTVSSRADESSNDTTKTLTEAFETRGSHSGGYFITTTGTYSESITIDSSFTKWEASGGNVTVTSVDFNSVTCTVDLANLTITTKLNDENVTYLNDYIYHGYKNYKKKLGYGGYK